MFVPPSEHFSLNMIVTVHWRGYRDDAGTIEVPAVAGSKASVPLTQAMINLGFEIELEDYFTLFKPIQPTMDDRLAGSARIHYSIVLPSGTVNSSDATPRVRGHQIGGATTFFAMERSRRRLDLLSCCQRGALLPFGILMWMIGGRQESAGDD